MRQPFRITVISMVTLAVISLFGTIQSVSAQIFYNSPYNRSAALQTLSRPTVSPYLNLAYRGGISNTSVGPSFPTYQTLVRPQIEAREAALASQQQYQQLQRQVLDIRQAVQSQQQNGQFATGHPTRYGTHSHYYPVLDQMGQQRR